MKRIILIMVILTLVGCSQLEKLKQPVVTVFMNHSGKTFPCVSHEIITGHDDGKCSFFAHAENWRWACTFKIDGEREFGITEDCRKIQEL